MSAKELPKSDRAELLRGAAAIWEMIDMIGVEGFTDHDLASVFTDNELQIRALVQAVTVDLI